MTTVEHNRIVIAIFVALLACLSGCWRHSEITAQEEGMSYLRLVGNLEGVGLRLDEGQVMELVDGDGNAAEEGTLWEVLPGRHLVELYRGGQSILRRDIYIGLGQAFDLAVPR